MKDSTYPEHRLSRSSEPFVIHLRKGRNVCHGLSLICRLEKNDPKLTSLEGKIPKLKLWSIAMLPQGPGGLARLLDWVAIVKIQGML